MIFFCPDCNSKLDQSAFPGKLYCNLCDCNFSLEIKFIKENNEHSLYRKQTCARIDEKSNR